MRRSFAYNRGFSHRMSGFNLNHNPYSTKGNATAHDQYNEGFRDASRQLDALKKQSINKPNTENEEKAN